jgi:hypothetical protein
MYVAGRAQETLSPSCAITRLFADVYMLPVALVNMLTRHRAVGITRVPTTRSRNDLAWTWAPTVTTRMPFFVFAKPLVNHMLTI